MSLRLTSSSDYETTPEGVYTARCYKVVDLGHQLNKIDGKYKPTVMVTWELLDEPYMKDGRPFSVSNTYTASLNEKSNLYRDLKGWLGRSLTADELSEFDMQALLGAYCTIQVVHNESNGNTYANVQTIMSTKNRPEPVNNLVFFDITTPDMATFANLSDYIKNKIRSSQEWDSGAEQQEYATSTEQISTAPSGAPINVGGTKVDPKSTPFNN